MEERFCEGCGNITDPSKVDLFATRGRYLCDDCLAKARMLSMPTQDSAKTPDDAPFFDSGTAPPAEPERLKFHCPLCDAALSIKPVKSKSKLTCPKCKEMLYVYPDGRVEQKMPKNTGPIPSEPLPQSAWEPQMQPQPPEEPPIQKIPVPSEEPAPDFDQTLDLPPVPPPQPAEDKGWEDMGQMLDMAPSPAAPPNKQEDSRRENDFDQTLDMAPPPVSQPKTPAESGRENDFGQTLDMNMDALNAGVEEPAEKEVFDETLDLPEPPPLEEIEEAPRHEPPPPRRTSPPPRPTKPEPVKDDFEFELGPEFESPVSNWEKEERPKVAPAPKLVPKPVPKPAPKPPKPAAPPPPAQPPQAPEQTRAPGRSRSRRKTTVVQQPVWQLTPAGAETPEISAPAPEPGDGLARAGEWRNLGEVMRSAEFRTYMIRKRRAFLPRAICIILITIPIAVLCIAMYMTSRVNSDASGGQAEFLRKLGEIGGRGAKVLNERSVNLPVQNSDAPPAQK